MKKILMFVMVVAMGLFFCSCGGSDQSDQEEVTSYSPSDIQVETLDDGTNVYSVIYDIDTSDSDAWKEAWPGYDSKEICVNTAVDGIKACMDRDDWTDGSVVYGYAQEAVLKNMLYSYGVDGNLTDINLFQLGIYNDTYTLQGEF